MGKASISQAVTGIIEPVISQEHLELVDVEYKKEGKNWFLRVYIDKEGGVTVNDCQKVSHLIEDIIEIDQVIHTSYILEVSSPGLDRPLKKEKDFLRFKNHRVKVTTFSSINNQKNFNGTLKDFINDTVLMECQGKIIEIPLESISKAHLIIEI